MKISTGAVCRINCHIKKHAEIMATALQSEFDHPHPIVVAYMKELDRK